ncbi:hypothetical protein Tco_0000411 [Tanacetum coccineum]
MKSLIVSNLALEPMILKINPASDDNLSPLTELLFFRRLHILPTYFEIHLSGMIRILYGHGSASVIAAVEWNHWHSSGAGAEGNIIPELFGTTGCRNNLIIIKPLKTNRLPVFFEGGTLKSYVELRCLNWFEQSQIIRKVHEGNMTVHGILRVLLFVSVAFLVVHNSFSVKREYKRSIKSITRSGSKASAHRTVELRKDEHRYENSVIGVSVFCGCDASYFYLAGQDDSNGYWT